MIEEWEVVGIYIRHFGTDQQLITTDGQLASLVVKIEVQASVSDPQAEGVFDFTFVRSHVQLRDASAAGITDFVSKLRGKTGLEGLDDYYYHCKPRVSLVSIQSTQVFDTISDTRVEIVDEALNQLFAPIVNDIWAEFCAWEKGNIEEICRSVCIVNDRVARIYLDDPESVACLLYLSSHWFSRSKTSVLLVETKDKLNVYFAPRIGDLLSLLGRESFFAAIESPADASSGPASWGTADEWLRVAYPRFDKWLSGGI